MVLVLFQCSSLQCSCSIIITQISKCATHAVTTTRGLLARRSRALHAALKEHTISFVADPVDRLPVVCIQAHDHLHSSFCTALHAVRLAHCVIRRHLCSCPHASRMRSQLAVASKIAALEGAARAVVMASGMASISTTLMALLSSGDHMLIQRDLYGGLQLHVCTRLGHPTSKRPYHIPSRAHANSRQLPRNCFPHRLLIRSRRHTFAGNRGPACLRRGVHHGEPHTRPWGQACILTPQLTTISSHRNGWYDQSVVGMVNRGREAECLFCLLSCTYHVSTQGASSRSALLASGRKAATPGHVQGNVLLCTGCMRDAHISCCLSRGQWSKFC